MFYFCTDVVLGMVIYCVLFAAVSISRCLSWKRQELQVELQALALGRLWWCLISCSPYDSCSNPVLWRPDKSKDIWDVIVVTFISQQSHFYIVIFRFSRFCWVEYEWAAGWAVHIIVCDMVLIKFSLVLKIVVEGNCECYN